MPYGTSGRAEEAKKRNDGATNLLNQASSGNLATGTYTWNGSSWMRQ